MRHLLSCSTPTGVVTVGRWNQTNLTIVQSCSPRIFLRRTSSARTESNERCWYKRTVSNPNRTSRIRCAAGRTAGLNSNEYALILLHDPNLLKSLDHHGMARCSSVRFPVSVCDGQAPAVSVRGFPSHPPEVNGSATEHTAFKVFYPVGRAAPAAVCKTAEAGAIPAQDSKPSPSASRRAKAARRSFSEGGLTSIRRGFGWQAILSGIGIERHT